MVRQGLLNDGGENDNVTSNALLHLSREFANWAQNWVSGLNPIDWSLLPCPAMEVHQLSTRSLEIDRNKFVKAKN